MQLLKILSGCTLIYKTNWYKSMFVDFDHTIYPDHIWQKKNKIEKLDLVNLGSSGGKWSFDYSDSNIKASNWAQQPQTLQEDFGLLRNFHDILKPKATVIITIMPFTGLNKETGIRDAMKFLKLDIDQEKDPIQPHLYQQAKKYTEYPILMGKPAIKAIVKYIFGKDKKTKKPEYSNLESNPMNLEELENDAKKWVNGWKKQFCISDFDAPLTLSNQQGRVYRIHLMQQLVDFCIDKGYRPVYVIPPETKQLSQYFTETFKENYIYSYLKDVNRNILTLDYSQEENWQKKDLFFNSFFLNQKGRKLFTQDVLTKLGY